MVCVSASNADDGEITRRAGETLLEPFQRKSIDFQEVPGRQKRINLPSPKIQQSSRFTINLAPLDVLTQQHHQNTQTKEPKRIQKS